jgi:glycosyltransferase involved in cell wall biosynthesis
MPEDHVRILMVEGAIGGGYEWGLETAIRVAERLQTAHSQKIELMVAGRVSPSLESMWKRKAHVMLIFAGVVPFESVPELDRSAHILYAADVNAACPNSVIEAMACGLPVVGFDTGALTELVTAEAGKLVPYGGDAWKLDPPDINGLAEAANLVIHQQKSFRTGARARAEQAFGLDKMVKGYLDALGI